MRMRMVPLGASFRPHARTVRDAALAKGKQARLVIEGEEVEADLAVVEQLRDPITHMVRNAVDHGVERPTSAGPAARSRWPRSRCAPATRRGSWWWRWRTTGPASTGKDPRPCA
jgi:hypothetical protein